MADNLIAPAAGAVLATRELGGAHYTAAILATDDGADVNAGNPLPVDIGAGPFAVTGTVALDSSALTALETIDLGATSLAALENITVGGTVELGSTSLAALESITATGPLTDTQLRATAVPVSLTDQLTLSGFQARIPTLGAKASSGSVSIVPASDATFPLPTGAATAAKQDQTAALIEATVALDAPFAITPHATDPLERETKAISLVTGGTVVYRHPDEGSDRTITLPSGLFPLRATHIRATSTAADLTGF